MSIKFEYYDIMNDLLKEKTDSYISIVSSGISSKTELFDCLEKSLNLPGYFGKNWDALYDCLTDFHWILEKEIIILHKDIPLILEKDRKVYLEILEDVHQSWVEDEDHTLLIYFPNYCKKEIEAILEQ